MCVGEGQAKKVHIFVPDKWGKQENMFKCGNVYPMPCLEILVGQPVQPESLLLHNADDKN